MTNASKVVPRLTSTQWLICIIAVIGFAFDTYELLMLPLIIRDAVTKLGGFAFGTPEFSYWRDLFLGHEKTTRHRWDGTTRGGESQGQGGPPWRS